MPQGTLNNFRCLGASLPLFFSFVNTDVPAVQELLCKAFRAKWYATVNLQRLHFHIWVFSYNLSFIFPVSKKLFKFSEFSENISFPIQTYTYTSCFPHCCALLPLLVVFDFLSIVQFEWWRLPLSVWINWSRKVIIGLLCSVSYYLNINYTTHPTIIYLLQFNQQTKGRCHHFKLHNRSSRNNQQRE